MSIDREDPSGEEQSALSTFTVDANGCFGSMTWVIARQLYDLLPRGARDELLRMTGDRKISLFFSETTERLLRQADCSASTQALSCDWSFETVEVTCSFGQVTWMVGEGLWEELPEDQRETLLLMSKDLIHEYFHSQIQRPLVNYAYGKLHG